MMLKMYEKCEMIQDDSPPFFDKTFDLSDFGHPRLCDTHVHLSNCLVLVVGGPPCSPLCGEVREPSLDKTISF